MPRDLMPQPSTFCRSGNFRRGAKDTSDDCEEQWGGRHGRLEPPTRAGTPGWAGTHWANKQSVSVLPEVN